MPPFLPHLLAVVALSLLMVFVMVRFSRAVLVPVQPSAEEGGPEPGRWGPRARWGAAYALVWLALIGAFLALFDALGEPRNARNLMLLAGVAGGFLALHALLLWFAYALARAGQPTPRFPGEPEPEEVDPLEGTGVSSAVAAEPAAPEPVAETPPEGEARGAWRRAWLLARNVAIALVAIALAQLIAELIPSLKELEAYLAAHRRAFLVPVAAVAALGFALFMGAVIDLVLTSGRPMSRREIEELERRARLHPGPSLARGGAVHLAGEATGAAASDTASFAEIKTAWRLRAWQVSRHWRRWLVLLVGVALLVSGLFGLLIVLAPISIKILLAAAFLYMAVNIARGFARA